MKTRILVLSPLSILLIVLFAYGQSTIMKAKIPFEFTAEGKVLPAGQYELIPGSDPDVIRVVGSGRGAGVMAMVVTRLAGPLHTSSQDAHIVFDQVGNTYTLSEVWGATGDGYLVYATKVKHEHRTINVPK